MSLDNPKNRKQVDPDDIPNWDLPDVFMWVSDMSLAKDRSPAFMAAGESWMIVRSTCQDHHRRPQMSLSLHSINEVPARDDYNAVKLRVLLANLNLPHSLIRERTFPLPLPSKCVLATMMLMEELQDPANEWLSCNKLQVRVCVQTLQMELPATFNEPNAAGGPVEANMADAVQDVQADARGSGGGADGEPSASRKRQRGGDHNRNNHQQNGIQVLALMPQLKQENGAGHERAGQSAQLQARGVSGGAVAAAPAPVRNPEAVLRASVISTLYPLVKRLLPHNGITRTELWHAVSERLSLVEAQMICDVGLGLLNDEWKGGSGDPQACIALMRSMLHL